jgi:hypothetical protein
VTPSMPVLQTGNEMALQLFTTMVPIRLLTSLVPYDIERRLLADMRTRLVDAVIEERFDALA